MEVRIGYGFPSSLPGAASPPRPQEIGDSGRNAQPFTSEDVFSAPTAANGNKPPVTRLASETREETGAGYRRTQVFEQADGRNFTRVEDVAITATGARRTVIQQNPSGSMTRYEEVLDREPSGTFRRTQRFQDETGQSATEITANYKVTDHYILSGGFMGAQAGIPQSNTAPSRGVYIDIQM